VDYPAVLVTGATLREERGALLLVNLNEGTHQVVLPYQVGGLAIEPDRVWVAHLDAHRTRTRLDVFGRGAPPWTRLVPHCTDTHSLVRTGDRLAAASTGTNEVVFLDLRGNVVERWSPDPHAEPDSWHLNSLVAWGGRLAMTCFGRFTTYREYTGRPQGTGMLVEIPSGAVLASGLTFPHDPSRVEDGWFINDARLHRTVFFKDGEAQPRMVCDWPLFARGLLVMPRCLIVGLSAWRHDATGTGSGAVAVVDRATGQVLKTISLPYAEIGHIVPAPEPDLLSQMIAEGPRLAALEEVGREVLPPGQQQGTITALGPLEPVAGRPGQFRVLLRLTNLGSAVWSSHDDGPVWLGHEILSAEQAVLCPAPPVQDLPMPVLPGRTLTFSALLDLSAAAWVGLASHVRLTLVSADGSWWRAHGSWQPCVLPLASGAGLPSQAAALEASRESCRDLAERLRATAEDLATTRAALDASRAAFTDLSMRWAPVADLGPTSVQVARRVHHLSRRVPGIAALVKRVLN
jgi:hypothetical protein